MKSKPIAVLLDVQQIIVPDGIQRPHADVVADRVLRSSIEKGGIQIPLVVLVDKDRHLLIDGTRRLEIARSLGIPKVPCALDSLPAGEPSAEGYAMKIRFHLDDHRQDLLPSQIGTLIAAVKEQMKLDNKGIAAYLGVAPDSITNWLSVLRYIPPVQQAMDRGVLTMAASRIFDGMTAKGQEHVWERHHGELTGAETNGARKTLHKRLRKLYGPVAHPSFYRNAKLAAIRGKQQPGAKRKSQRPNYSEAEKRKLLKSLDIKDAELVELKEENADNLREIKAATPIVAAFLRNPKLRALVPEVMLDELEEFAKSYC